MSRLATWASILLIIWALLEVTPLRWWGFNAHRIAVSDASTIAMPIIRLDREIWRHIRMRYQVIVRRLETDEVVCDTKSAIFTYRPTSQLPAGDGLNLAWLAPGDSRCLRPLPTGNYWLEVCWTAPYLLGGLLGPKTACLDSNPFAVTPVKQANAASSRRSKEPVYEH